MSSSGEDKKVEPKSTISKQNSNSSGDDDKTPEDHHNHALNSEIIAIGGAVIGSMIVSSFYRTFARIAAALAIPCASIYLMSTCPTDESFEYKKELKRVYRGEKLPEDHPAKPKNFLQKAYAKATATVAAEADDYAGCKLEIIDFMGLVKVASVFSQTQNKYFYWLGAVHQWRYMFMRDVPVEESKKD